MQNSEVIKLKQLLKKQYISRNGHNVHKLKGKDSTGRWAYYFVLIEPEMENKFLKAIEAKTGTIDFENYGEVIASCYGETPTQEVKNHLKELYGFDL